ncbi:hypothetical protein AMATHDRAFT_43847 [Amanita thiersii Skay4041]|uniref:Uncharacterized protein n=1 Tax=Amanita thiersii Skay4041 TaxID=703135 RepID=A0A2A9N6Z0_9AGAR|nr:hypothetical protein AMATHDRAFT_43847 [Amanita thiersii Skay4041]
MARASMQVRQSIHVFFLNETTSDFALFRVQTALFENQKQVFVLSQTQTENTSLIMGHIEEDSSDSGELIVTHKVHQAPLSRFISFYRCITSVFGLMATSDPQEEKMKEFGPIGKVIQVDDYTKHLAEVYATLPTPEDG